MERRRRQPRARALALIRDRLRVRPDLQLDELKTDPVSCTIEETRLA
jgi:hypothetical protein